MRRAAKVDANHAEIVSCFLAAGFSVQSLATVGYGCPDLLLGIDGRNVLVEIKNGEQAVRRYNSYQRKWHAEWRGTTHVVSSVDEALLLCKLYRNARAA